MITSKIRQRLQSISTEHYARLQICETKAHQILEYSQGGSHIEFTPHGLTHISAVEQNYDWLIPEIDIQSFNAAELFCLLCATFLHDAMMIPQKMGGEADARKNHAEKSQDFLLKNKDLLSLSIHEADAISQVIKMHAVENIEEITQKVVLGNEIVDIRKIGACLSLSDICHADSSRAPEIVFNHLDIDSSSRDHWRKHMQISGVTREEDSILVSALTFSNSGSRAVNDYLSDIEKQLSIIKPYFNTLL